MTGSSLDRAVVEIDADINGDGSSETGVFHMVGNLELTQVVQPSPALGSEFDTISSIIQRTLNDGDAQRRGVVIDLGAGRHVIEANFIGWEGARDAGNNSLQWGNTGETGDATVGDATGADPLVQMQVFNRYLQVGVIDSLNPMRVYVGEYTDGTYGSEGIYSEFAPLKMVVENSNAVRTTDSPESYDGSLRFVEVLDLSGAVDVRRRLPV